MSKPFSGQIGVVLSHSRMRFQKLKAAIYVTNPHRHKDKCFGDSAFRVKGKEGSPVEQPSRSVLHLDLTLTQSEDARAKHKMRPVYEKLRGKTLFDDWELSCALHIFYKLTLHRPLGRTEFREFMHTVFRLSRHDMVDRIYSALDEPGKNVVGLKAKNFVKMLALYCRGNLQARMDFAFRVYDSMSLGYISREMMVKLLVPTFLSKGASHENVETATDMVDLLMRKLDMDKDGRLTYDEFVEQIWANPDLLEIFGQVFPDRMVVYAFMTMFTRNVTTRFADYFNRSDIQEYVSRV